MLQRKMEATF